MDMIQAITNKYALPLVQIVPVPNDALPKEVRDRYGQTMDNMTLYTKLSQSLEAHNGVSGGRESMHLRWSRLILICFLNDTVRDRQIPYGRTWIGPRRVATTTRSTRRSGVYENVHARGVVARSTLGYTDTVRPCRTPTIATTATNATAAAAAAANI